MPLIELHLTHLPQLRHADGRSLVLNEKDAALLALVALEGPVQRSRVATLLWPGGGSDAPDAAERRALNNLRQRLFRISRFAGCELVSGGATLALNDDVAHDLAFDETRLLADAQAHAGELLGGHRYDDSAVLALWTDAARQRWRAARADALLGLITRLETAGRLGEALRLANRLVTDEPLMEHACRVLMRLHYRRGDRGAAQAEFERCRQALYEQTGEAPSDETIELSQAISRSDEAAPLRRPALPLALRHPPRTVGRDAVLQRAEHRWADRGVVLLIGAAGIGKSRVLADLTQRWRIPLQWRCPPESAASNFGLLCALAGQLAPLVRDRLAGELTLWLDWLTDPYRRTSPIQPVQPARLVAVWRSILDAAIAAGIQAIAIEDLHHADEASITVLCELLPASAPSEGTMRWLLNCRDNELPPPLQQWIDRQPLGHYPVVPVEPLDAEATAEFLAGLGLGGAGAQAAAQLHRHCGGHPLFMLQVLRQLQLGGELDAGHWPARLPLPDDAMVNASLRLARAEPAAQQMAFLAALCGPDFSADLMCRLLRQNASELLTPWRRLEELHIFGAQGFAHDLIREAVLSVLPQALAPLLHREIARALEETGADPLRRALHWDAGGVAVRAATEFTAAARVAQDCGLDLQAVQWLLRASANHRKAGQAAAAFECEWRAGHLTLSASSLHEAAEIAARLLSEAATTRQEAMAHELLAAVKVEKQDLAAIDDARQAMALAQGLDDPTLIARCQLRLAESFALDGQLEHALAELERARSRMHGDDVELQFNWACGRGSVLASMGRRAEAVSVHRHHLDEALARRNLAHAAFSAGFCATHLAYLCRVNEAVTMARRGLELARQAGVERGLTLVDEMGLAGNLGDLGHFSEALAIGDRVISELQAAGLAGWALNAANDRAVIFMRLGRVDLALQLLAGEIGDVPVWVRAARRMVQARLDQWQGRSALPAMQQALALFEQGGVSLADYPRHKIALEAARATSPDAAVEAAAETLRWTRGHEHEAFRRYAQMVAIEANLRLGRIDDAAALAAELEQAEGLTEEAFGFYLPELLLVMGDAFAAAGQDERAHRCITAARAWVEDRAARQVPSLFVESFRSRNPINRRLATWPATGR